MTQRVLTQEDIQKIADTYHNWEDPNGDYQDIKGFCKSATIEEVKELDYVLTPGRYVGLSEVEYAFYCAVLDNKSARELMGKEKLKNLQLYYMIG